MKITNEPHFDGGDYSAPSNRTNIINTLTASDVIVWGGASFINVVLALFVVSFLENATAFHVGVAVMITQVTSSLCAIPVGRFFDRHRGYIDEVWGITIATFCYGVTYVLLSFATHVWHLFIAMFFVGALTTVNLISWRVLFYAHINKGEIGQVGGVYHTLFSLGTSVFSALGGLAGVYFGFDKVVLVGGIIIMAGSLLPLLIRNYLSPRERGGSGALSQ